MRASRPALTEALLVWGFWGIVAVLVGITYARLPPSETFGVSLSGAEGGASRAAVILAGPFAPVAAALALVAAARLGGRRADVTAAVAVVLCLTVALPGVMRRDDLDLRIANAPALVGVVLAAALTIVALVAAGPGAARTWSPGDTARAALVVALAVLALPWLLAEVGVRPSVVPGLEDVHLGHHEGLDGVLHATSALLLSRSVPALRRPLAGILGAYLALILAYGLAVAAADAWNEQVVRRGWTDWRPPDVLVPHANASWAAVVAGAIAAYLLFFRGYRDWSASSAIASATATRRSIRRSGSPPSRST